jgi:hypothetical protein
VAGACAGGPAITCPDDADPCTDAACDPKAGCGQVPNTAACDDASVCTLNDTCAAGKCGGEPIDCDDKNVCTADYCHPAIGCLHGFNQGAACTDGSVCTQVDTCDGTGKCVGGKPLDCADTAKCTIDACDKTAGCVHPIDANCECASTGDCNDGKPGTYDCCRLKVLPTFPFLGRRCVNSTNAGDCA